MKLSIAIMAVPSRRAHVDALLDRLAAQVLRAKKRGRGASFAPPMVFWDTDRAGPWHCWKGAWQARPCDATHHAIVQDDVLVCADLPETLLRLAEARPGDPVSGFLPRRSVELAVAADARWVSTRRFLWAQCLLLPASLGDAALRWIEDNERLNPDWRRHDDSRLAAFFEAHRRQVFVAVPHPVEHVGDAIGGSVMGHHGPAAKRRARPGAWLGEEQPLGALDWSNLQSVRE